MVIQSGDEEWVLMSRVASGDETAISELYDRFGALVFKTARQVLNSRAEAEDGCALVEVDYEELAAVTDPETALDPRTPVIHPELGDNLTFERVHVAGDPDKGFAEADEVVETTFMFGRHTGVCNEARAIVADWNAGEQRMTVYHGTQAPHMMQNLFAKHLGLAETQVRVITKDVGGSFGIKVHTYADEMATVALSGTLVRAIAIEYL